MMQPRRISEAQAALELEQLKALRRAEATAIALQKEQLAARAKEAARPRGSRSPGLPAARMCNPRSYVTQADLRELGGHIKVKHRAELERKAVRGELSPTAIAIACVLYVFRGLRGGPDGCGVQAPLEAWARELGASRRQVAYAFRELEAAGWVRRRRRLVKHRWADLAGNEWRQADVHGVAYLLKRGAVELQPASWRKDGRRVVIGVVGKLLAVASRKLLVLARRVTDALKRCTPTTQQDKSFKPSGARSRAPLSTGPPGPTPSGHRFTGREEHRVDAQRFAAGPQGEGALSMQQLYPEWWASTDARAHQWAHALFVKGGDAPREKRSEAQRRARREWVRRRANRR